MKERIQWVDVAKFFGIFVIYLGHFGNDAGAAYTYVFKFHVPLFFMISGCMESKNTRRVMENIYHKFVNLMIPFFAFGLLSIILCTVKDNAAIGTVAAGLQVLAKGAIRNQFFAASLWFLTCLFVVEVMFTFTKKLKYTPLILGCCFVCYLIAQNLIEPRPAISPHWLYNIDSALYYIIFYAIGYVSFKKINEIFKAVRHRDKMIIAVTGTSALVYAALLFFQKDLLVNVLSIFIKDGKYLGMIHSVLCPLVMIWAIFVLAWLCRNITLFRDIGKNTLYLCGSEYIVKTCFPLGVALFGGHIELSNPLSAYFYTFLLLYLANRFLAPIEKKVFESIRGYLSSKHPGSPVDISPRAC